MGIIELSGMQFYSYHGYFKSEEIIGNKFEVDLSIETDCSKAAKTDLLSDTLNYDSVYQLVKEQMKVRSKLLEHVAGRIIDQLYVNFTEIYKVKVKISKLNPPLGGEIGSVSVTMER